MSTVLPSSSWVHTMRDLGLLVCHCPDPIPVPVRLFGRIPLDVFECWHCRRKVVT